MEISFVHLKRWFLIRKAGALNTHIIAKYFAKDNAYFNAYQTMYYKLRKYKESELCIDEHYAITHDLLTDLMLDDIYKHYGREVWLNVRTRITYINPKFY